MLITSINPHGSYPQFNLTAIAKAASNHSISNPLDWLQMQQNEGGLLPIRAYVDRQSNIYINDLQLYLQYLTHCLGFNSVQAGV